MGGVLAKLFAGDVQAAGSVLDRVISQPHTEEHTVLYKLADYKKGIYIFNIMFMGMDVAKGDLTDSVRKAFKLTFAPS
jgi:hypothetical protein